ncbi:MAG: aldo/keto reductase [Myxococcota bacterium]
MTTDPWLAPRAADAPAALALGCMNFGQRTPAAEARRIVDRALDAGIGWLDTANAYGDGVSERIVGEALRGRRAAARVATKVGLMRIGGRPEGLGPQRVLAACRESLDRLGVDALDLYTLHAPDPRVPPDETLSAVAELLASGLIRQWGVSNHASWQILELRTLAAARGLPPPAAAQQLYNALVRQLELEYFAFARRYPIHTTVYNPLAGGLLTGLHTFDAPPPAGGRFARNKLYQGRYWRRASFEAVEALRGVANDAGTTLVGLAYGFVRGAPGVDSVLVGPATVDHLDQALAAGPLSDEARRRVVAIGVERDGTDASYAR